MYIHISVQYTAGVSAARQLVCAICTLSSSKASKASIAGVGVARQLVCARGEGTYCTHQHKLAALLHLRLLHCTLARTSCLAAPTPATLALLALLALLEERVHVALTSCLAAPTPATVCVRYVLSPLLRRTAHLAHWRFTALLLYCFTTSVSLFFIASRICWSWVAPLLVYFSSRLLFLA